MSRAGGLRSAGAVQAAGRAGQGRPGAAGGERRGLAARGCGGEV